MSPKFHSWIIRICLPTATWWVGRQERRILKNGVELNSEEKLWAKQVGVVDVDRVRLMFVPQVPLPGTPISNFIADVFKKPITPIGLAARYGIYVDKDCRNDPSLLVHELTHVAQYERLGGIKEFLHQYLVECLRDGYDNAQMEHEARNAAIPFNRPPNHS